MICARIIGDLTVFAVLTSGPILAESLRRAGIDARWVREPRPGDLEPGEVVMEMVTRSISSAWHPPACIGAGHRPRARLSGQIRAGWGAFPLCRSGPLNGRASRLVQPGKRAWVENTSMADGPFPV